MNLSTVLPASTSLAFSTACFPTRYGNCATLAVRRPALRRRLGEVAHGPSASSCQFARCAGRSPSVHGRQVRIGVEAPRSVSVRREELPELETPTPEYENALADECYLAMMA